MCPRHCMVMRDNGEKGFCRETNHLRVARAALHMWEEPCISGEEGSGTVFFTGCNLRCVYCQNYDLSRSVTGKEITISRLAEIFLELQQKGANNINLVTPTHFVPADYRGIEMCQSSGITSACYIQYRRIRVRRDACYAGWMGRCLSAGF